MIDEKLASGIAFDEMLRLIRLGAWAKQHGIPALVSIAAEKCKPSFDEQLPKLDRATLISLIDTDTKLARDTLAALPKGAADDQG